MILSKGLVAGAGVGSDHRVSHRRARAIHKEYHNDPVSGLMGLAEKYRVSPSAVCNIVCGGISEEFTVKKLLKAETPVTLIAERIGKSRGYVYKKYLN